MFDKSMDINVTNYLVQFVTITEEGVPMIVFLGL